MEVYVHSDGRLVVVVEVNCETDFVAKTASFQELAHELALQIAAANPTYISEADIPAEVIEAETKAITERSRAEGKPETILPKIVMVISKNSKMKMCCSIRNIFAMNHALSKTWLTIR